MNHLKKNIAFLKINPYVDYQLRDIHGNIIDGTKNDALMEKLKSLGYVHYGFYVDMDEKKDLEPRWISVLDIKDKTIDELFKNFRSGTKWGINNSKKNFINLIEADENNLVEFKNLMKHTAERREFIDRPLSYYQNMFKVLDKESGEYRDLDLNKKYVLAGFNYHLLSQGDGMAMFKDAKLIDAEGTLDIELLENYIVDHLGGTIGEEYAEPQGRITFTKGN